MSGDRSVTAEVPASLIGERIDRIVAMVTDVSRTEAARLVAPNDTATTTPIARTEIHGPSPLPLPRLKATPVLK